MEYQVLAPVVYTSEDGSQFEAWNPGDSIDSSLVTDWSPPLDIDWLVEREAIVEKQAAEPPPAS